jgi:hypothetical protein
MPNGGTSTSQIEIISFVLRKVEGKFEPMTGLPPPYQDSIHHLLGRPVVTQLPSCSGSVAANGQEEEAAPEEGGWWRAPSGGPPGEPIPPPLALPLASLSPLAQAIWEKVPRAERDTFSTTEMRNILVYGRR